MEAWTRVGAPTEVGDVDTVGCPKGGASRSAEGADEPTRVRSGKVGEGMAQSF